MWRLSEEDKKMVDKFLEFFLKAEGQLHKNGTSLLTTIELLYNVKPYTSMLLKYLAENFYLTNTLGEEEKSKVKTSPWFPELRLNLKYPTNFDVKDFLKSPNSEWSAFLREDQTSFLIFYKNNYITEISLPYEVESFALWDDYLALIDQQNNLRVIYLPSLREVFSREEGDFKEVLPDKDKLYLVYKNGIIQTFTINETGIRFESITDKKPEGKGSGIGLSVGSWKDSQARGLSFSPDGKYLAVSVIGTNKVFVFSTSSFEKVWEKGFDNYPNQVSFSPDGIYLVVGLGSGYARIYSTESWEKVREFSKFGRVALVVTFSADGKYFAFGGEYGKLYVYETSGWESIFEKKVDKNILNLSFHPDGRYLAVSDKGGKITVFDMEGNTVVEFEDYMGDYDYTMSFSPDGRYLVYLSGEGDIKVVSVESWEEVARVEGFRFVISSDGKFLISVWGDRITLWGFEGFEEISYYVPRKDKEIVSIAVSSDMSYIACGYKDGTVVVLTDVFNFPPLKKVAYRLEEFLWMEPYLLFVDEEGKAFVWAKEKDGFVYKHFLGNINSSEEFRGLEAVNVEGWRVGQDFILFGVNNTVGGSRGFERHVNVLLGGMVEDFEVFKNLILKDPLEVLEWKRL